MNLYYNSLVGSKDKLVLFLFLIFSPHLYGQQDVSKNYTATPHTLRQVVISASRSARNIKQITIPASIVSNNQIKLSGSLRLTNILQEQTGLITMGGNHGVDFQIQGLQSKHVLFLIDDEPIIGRIAGILDLNRISLSNIGHIEVIKGPSSVLYGSDALGGVINLITSNPAEGFHGSFYSRYGGNLQWNFGGSLTNKINKSWFSLYLDHYQGVNKIDNSKPLDEGNLFSNYSLGGSFSHRFSKNIEFKSSLRTYFSRELRKSTFPYEKDSINEYSLSNRLNLGISPKWKTSIRFYNTYYVGKTRSNDNKQKNVANISNRLNKPEILSEYRFNKKNILSGGLGFFHLKISEENRYHGTKKSFSKYLFSQYEWKPFKKFYLVGGLRYEKDINYGEALLPKFSFRYDILRNLNLKASIGKGFKAPDFETLYLNFDHSEENYFVYGVNELPLKLKEHAEKQELTTYEGRNLENPIKIKPEYSWGTNIGFEFSPAHDFQLSINFFHNAIKNLIEYIKVAEFKSTKAPDPYRIFSYDNLSKAFTKGIEVEFKKHFWKCFYLSAGYQYLDSGDQTIKEKLKKNSIEGNPIRVECTKGKYRNATLSDYPGLSQRSRHSANAKIFYEHKKKGFFASLRGVYMGKYYKGSLDSKKNDQYITLENYVKGNLRLYFSLGKKFPFGFEAQMGIDNLFNYQDPKRLGLPERLFWGRLSYLF